MVLNETMYKKTSKYLIFLQNTLTLPQRNTIMDIEALTQEAIGPARTDGKPSFRKQGRKGSGRLIGKFHERTGQNALPYRT